MINYEDAKTGEFLNSAKTNRTISSEEFIHNNLQHNEGF